ncbi:uncharacterized protein LOC131628458 [Vicia villosa]|uniref:uncharacterized protein LOC131628458 n=1 Tax=Vicia villosa TaxID=3911 RepID=UPI00273BC747|nr:uncharacterized protein LOC131628458 [Vicia villosa]
MFPVSPSSKLKEDEKFCFSPVKWYLDRDVTELNWAWDDYISYIELEKLIHEVGYTSLKGIWYVNPRFSFSRGLTPIENDRDVLRFDKYVEGFDLVDVYVEHAIDIPVIVDEEELGNDGNLAENVAEGGPNVEVENMDEGVTSVEVENVAEGHPNVEVENMDEGVTNVEAENVAEGNPNVEVDNMDEGVTNVDGENVVEGPTNVEGENMQEGDNNDDVDFVGDSDDDSIEVDWTTVLPTDTSEVPTKHVADEDSDQLYTPPNIEDEQEYEHFPNFQSSGTLNFKLDLVFNNKDVIKDAVKEYAMVNNKNVYFKKNDGKMMVVNYE